MHTFVIALIALSVATSTPAHAGETTVKLDPDDGCKVEATLENSGIRARLMLGAASDAQAECLKAAEEKRRTEAEAKAAEQKAKADAIATVRLADAASDAVRRRQPGEDMYVNTDGEVVFGTLPATVAAGDGNLPFIGSWGVGGSVAQTYADFYGVGRMGPHEATPVASVRRPPTPDPPNKVAEAERIMKQAADYATAAGAP